MNDINKALITVLVDAAKGEGISNKCNHVAGGVAAILNLEELEDGTEIFARLKYKGLDAIKLLTYLGDFCAFGEIVISEPTYRSPRVDG